ncbi:unnamed protein product [Prorocentrum cordatum]|uniref:Subtilisin n=1 Tax=Prorocentrum cordatum TaxID=2364126 RepID=A0ABN9SYB6_9DINO|nr:unnamed protein product [Polarella glacialis]
MIGNAELGTFETAEIARATENTEHSGVTVQVRQSLKHNYAAETDVTLLSHGASAEVMHEAKMGTFVLSVDNLATFDSGDNISITSHGTFGSIPNSIGSLDLDAGTVQLDEPLNKTVPQGATIVKELSSTSSAGGQCNRSDLASNETTFLTDPVMEGAHRLPVECESKFTVNGSVRIVGYSHSETGTIDSLNFSSIWLRAPLQRAYRAGSSVTIATPSSATSPAEAIFDDVATVFNSDLVSSDSTIG